MDPLNVEVTLSRIVYDRKVDLSLYSVKDGIIYFKGCENSIDDEQLEETRKQLCHRINTGFVRNLYLEVYPTESRNGRDAVVWKVKNYAVKRYRDPRGFRYLVEHEYYHLKKLNHPNIVKIKSEYLIDNVMVGFVMEWSEYTLIDKFKEDQYHDKWILEIKNALLYLHQKDMVHGDLCPENILIHKNSIRLCDLAPSGFRYHIRWCSPEVLFENNEDHTKDDDIFSYGMIAYFLQGKKPPFEDKVNSELEVLRRQENGLTMNEIPDGKYKEIIQNAITKRKF